MTEDAARLSWVRGALHLHLWRGRDMLRYPPDSGHEHDQVRERRIAHVWRWRTEAIHFAARALMGGAQSTVTFHFEAISPTNFENTAGANLNAIAELMPRMGPEHVNPGFDAKGEYEQLKARWAGAS